MPAQGWNIKHMACGNTTYGVAAQYQDPHKPDNIDKSTITWCAPSLSRCSCPRHAPVSAPLAICLNNSSDGMHIEGEGS